jgi:hypothetical protein
MDGDDKLVPLTKKKGNSVGLGWLRMDKTPWRGPLRKGRKVNGLGRTKSRLITGMKQLLFLEDENERLPWT